MAKRKIFLTGATGVMGSRGLKELMARPDQYEVTVLARPSKRNRRKLLPFEEMGVKVVWGDLKDPEAVAKGMEGCELVLHVGGMVSPAADWYPEQTIETNLSAMRNIISAAEAMPEKPAVVYIGSVAQYGDRKPPIHWGGSGEPLAPAFYDAYAYSKTEAERMLAESDLPRWVSLRQTGILHSGLLKNGLDPITFHVPIDEVLEWVTADDSGRLLERVSRPGLPESFWKKFYNIGGGEAFRLTNYEFETRLLKAMGCPPPEKVFDLRWFATRNFHGMWYTDSDELEDLLHFREGISPDEYFARMKSELPWFYSLAPLAPACIMKLVMGRVSRRAVLGPMWWMENGKEGRIEAAFGSRKEWEALPGWEGRELPTPSREKPRRKDAPVYTLSEMQRLARERGGECLGIAGEGKDSIPADGRIDPDSRLRFRCDKGDEFTLRARTFAEGGHWCPECMKRRVRLEEWR